MSGKPESACVTHRPPKPGQEWRLADSGYRICGSCFDRLRTWLAGGEEEVGEDNEGNPITRPASIPGLYALLDPTPTVTEEGRRGPGFGSRSPASDHVIAMTDPRSKSHEVARDGVEYAWDPEADNGYPPRPQGVYGPERPPGAYVEKRDVWRGSDGRLYTEETAPVRSIAWTLGSWADFVSEERELTGRIPGDVDGLGEFLDRHLDWVARQDWVDEFTEDMRLLYRQLKSTTGDREQPPLGRCIELLDTGTCGAPIYMPRGEKPRAPDEPITDLPELACQSCGSRYSGRRLILLRLNQQKEAS